MSFDFKSLELFIRVAAVGAIGKAGAEFGLSSTAASQRIQALEDAVGTKLLHRTTRAVSLSSEGEVFLEHAKRILSDLEEALADVQEDPESISGELRVACSASFGRKHIAPYMAEFLKLYPKVSLHLELSDAVIDIVEGGFDVAIRLGTLAPSTLKARKIGVSPRVLVASPEFLEKAGTPQTLEDIKDYNCIQRCNIKNWEMRKPNGEIFDVKIDGNFNSNLAEAVTEAAISGIGLTRKCAWEIEEYLKDGRLIRLFEDHVCTPEWNVYAVRPPSKVAPKRVEVFCSFLEQKFKRVGALNGSLFTPPVFLGS